MEWVRNLGAALPLGVLLLHALLIEAVGFKLLLGLRRLCGRSAALGRRIWDVGGPSIRSGSVDGLGLLGLGGRDDGGHDGYFCVFEFCLKKWFERSAREFE